MDKGISYWDNYIPDGLYQTKDARVHFQNFRIFFLVLEYNRNIHKILSTVRPNTHKNSHEDYLSLKYIKNESFGIFFFEFRI